LLAVNKSLFQKSGSLATTAIVEVGSRSRDRTLAKIRGQYVTNVLIAEDNALTENYSASCSRRVDTPCLKRADGQEALG